MFLWVLICLWLSILILHWKPLPVLIPPPEPLCSHTWGEPGKYLEEHRQGDTKASVSRAGTGDAGSPGFRDPNIKNGQKSEPPSHSFSKHRRSLLGLCSTPGRCESHGKDRIWDFPLSLAGWELGISSFKSISLYQFYVTFFSQSHLWSKIQTVTLNPLGWWGVWVLSTNNKLGFPKTLGKTPKSYQQIFDPHKTRRAFCCPAHDSKVLILASVKHLLSPSAVSIFWHP